MATHGYTGKKAKRGPELAQRSRAAILDALDIVESKGKSIGELLAVDLMQNPSRFMELAAKFCPKDIVAEIEHTFTASQLSDDDLADIAATGSRRATKAPRRPQQTH